jgi:hypothetical protein
MLNVFGLRSSLREISETRNFFEVIVTLRYEGMSGFDLPLVVQFELGSIFGSADESLSLYDYQPRVSFYSR